MENKKKYRKSNKNPFDLNENGGFARITKSGAGRLSKYKRIWGMLR